MVWFTKLNLFGLFLLIIIICGFRRGAIVTTFIVCYALTSFISGYVSGGMYSRNGGMTWSNLSLFFPPCLSWFFMVLPCFIRQKLDKVYDPHSIPFSIYGLWDWVLIEHNCYILRISSCYSLWHNGGCLCNLGFHFFPSGTSWHSCWKKLEWCSK